MSVQPGTVAGATLELHAAKANAGASPGVNTPSFITAWADTGGGAHNGTLTTFAGNAASGWAGTGTEADPYRLVFDGTSDYVALADLSVAEDKVFSYEAWFITSADGYLIAEGLTTDYNRLVVLHVLGGKVTAYEKDASALLKTNTGLTTVSDGALHHAVFTCDGTNMRVYVDGLLDQPTPTAVGTGALAINVCRVGSNARTTPTSFFPGAIAVARIHPFCLTPAEVAQNYAAGSRWAVAPTVTTTVISGIRVNGALSGGNVTDGGGGGAPVTARGVCWNSTGAPTVANDKTVDAGTTGTFTSTLTGLGSVSTYYVRAYATNSAGTTYGAEVSFTTPNYSAAQLDPNLVIRGLGGLGAFAGLLVLGGMGGGEEAPVIVTELSCDMVNGAEFEIEPDQRAATMTTGCDMVNGARMSMRPLREGVVLPETDSLGWTAPDAAASPLWDLAVTIGGLRIPNALITSFLIELDAHGGFESCAISFASKRTRKWPSRAQIVVAYDGMHPFEGRLATQRRSIGTELGWSLEFVGDLGDLRNHRAFRCVYVDSDLDNVLSDQGPNTAANVFEVTASE